MNILLLTADSLRCDRTTLFGHARETTPFLSDLADRGFEFRRAYANGRNTAASFPAIHTSVHERSYEGVGIPDSGTPTMAELLQEAGYRTHGIHTNELLSHEYNYNRGFDIYRDSRTGNGTSGWRTAARNLIGDGLVFDLVKRAHFLSTEYLGVKIFDTADAVSGFEDRILEWTTSGDGDWFIWAHYMNPHHPYEPPADCQEALGLDPIAGREATRLSRKMRLRPENVTDAEREALRGLYDASVLSWDREIESTYHRLADAGELDSTLVVVTADHGELLGEDGVYGHPPVLDQALLRVPLVFSGPPVGTGESDAQVGLIDLAPTVVTLAGADVPDRYRGRSLYTPAEGFEAATSTIQLCETGDSESLLVAGIDGDRKIVHDRGTDTWRGYALTETALEEVPAETIDDDLKDAVGEYERRSEEEQRGGATVGQEQLREDLRALGYLE